MLRAKAQALVTYLEEPLTQVASSGSWHEKPVAEPNANKGAATAPQAYLSRESSRSFILWFIGYLYSIA